MKVAKEHHLVSVHNLGPLDDCGLGSGPGRGPPLFSHGLKDMQDVHRFKLQRCMRLPDN